MIALSLLCVLFFTGSALAVEPKAEGPATINILTERQKAVKTIKARFAQEKRAALLKRPIKSEGDFYFKSPVGVRWEYKNGPLVIYDGGALYLYYPELREAEKMSGAGGFIGPLVFDLKLLLKDYTVDATQSDVSIVLSLRPKKRMPFKSMEMIFSKGSKNPPFPNEVRVTEETGDSTLILFSDIKINEPLKDGLFVFKPPKGVKIRERTYAE